MTVTIWVMVSAVVLLIIYDVIAAIKWGVPATISHTLLAISRKWPIIPFALGTLIGHFFWSQS